MEDTPAGEKVWLWTYQASPDDPQVFRAFAEAAQVVVSLVRQVPSLRRSFQGDWCRGSEPLKRTSTRGRQEAGAEEHLPGATPSDMRSSLLATRGGESLPGCASLD